MEIVSLGTEGHLQMLQTSSNERISQQVYMAIFAGTKCHTSLCELRVIVRILHIRSTTDFIHCFLLHLSGKKGIEKFTAHNEEVRRGRWSYTGWFRCSCYSHMLVVEMEIRCREVGYAYSTFNVYVSAF